MPCLPACLPENASKLVTVSLPHQSLTSTVSMVVCRAWFDRYWGWVVTAVAFMIYLISTGSLGIFVLLYIYFKREFMDSAIAVGWIGSLANGMLNLMSFISSPLYERYNHRTVIVVGVLLCSMGILTTSFTQSLWQNYLTFGVVFAVGLNFICNPSMNMLSVYFPVGNQCQRALAIAGSGQAVGTLLMSPLLEAMVSRMGWRRSLQIVAPIILVTCLPLAMVFKQPPSQALEEEEKDTKDTILKDEKTKMMSLECFTENLGSKVHASGESSDDQTKESDDLQKAESCTLYIATTVDASTIADNVTPDSSLSTTCIETSPAEPGKNEKTGIDQQEMQCGQNKYFKLHKYFKLLRSAKYGWFFVATVANCIALFFNLINLVSCMTVSGISESTAAWFITVLSAADFIFRIMMSLVSHSMPMSRISALAVNAGIGAAGSFLLTRGTNAWIFVVYCIIAGFCRALTFSLGFACLMEVFGISRAVETQTFLQIAYGIGALTASSIAGLSYDMTGTYQTTHYTCMGLWIGACLIYSVVWRWKMISSCLCKRNDVA